MFSPQQQRTRSLPRCVGDHSNSRGRLARARARARSLSKHAQCRESGAASSTMFPFFLQSENYNSQETTRRRVTASRCGPARSPPSCPALLLVPSPPSECVSVTQRRCEPEGPSGGAAAAAASTSSISRAARSDLPRALRERTTKRAPRLSLRPRLLSIRLRGQLPSRGLAGWRGRRRQNAGLSARAPRVRTLHPLAPDLGAVLGLRPPAIVR